MYQIRRLLMRYKALMSAAAVAAGIFLLTACTASDTGLAPAGTGSAPAGTQEGAAQTPGADAQGTDGGGEVSVQTQPQESVQDVVQGDTASPADGTAAPEQDGADAQTESWTPQETDMSEAPAVPGDEWSGVYVADQETVTITLTDPENISFSFAQSGISGTAAVDGYQAVFRGDDYHVVVFNIHSGLLDVSVSSEEDYDASASPLIGTYTKQ